MAAKPLTFYRPLDLAKNELRNALVQNLPAPPSGPVKGIIYFDTTLNKLGYYDGSTWIYGSTYTAGNGLALTGSDFSVNVDAASLEIASDVVRVKDGGITSAKIADGTIQDGDLAGGITNAKLATDPLARANHTGTQAAATISDFGDAVRAIPISELAPPVDGGPNVDMNGHTINSVADPYNPQDAATKAYVDSIATGIIAKKSVRAASTAQIAAANGVSWGPITLQINKSGYRPDNVPLAVGDRFLVKDESTPSRNGLWVVVANGGDGTAGGGAGGTQNFLANRTSDADGNSELAGGTFVFVQEGDTQADSGWVLATNGPVTPGTTAQSWVQFSGAGQIVAGAALTKAGNTLDVAVDGLTVLSTGDKLSTGKATDPSGGSIGVPGAVVFGQVGVARVERTAWTADGTASSFTTDNPAGTMLLSVTVFDSTYTQIEVDWSATNTTVTVNFVTPPASGTVFYATVMG